MSLGTAMTASTLSLLAVMILLLIMAVHNLLLQCVKLYVGAGLRVNNELQEHFSLTGSCRLY